MGLHKRRPTIGYFNQVLEAEWSVLPWQGAMQAARMHNVNLISFHGQSLLEANEYLSQQNIIYDLPRGGCLDGLIVWKGHLTKNLDDEAVRKFYEQYGVPVITIEGQLKGFPCITYGNYEGMKLVVDHLITVHGIKKIAFVGLVENHAGFQERYQGFRDAIREHGLEVDPDFVRPWCPWDIQVDGRPVEEVLGEWLARVLPRGLEAVIGSCDPVAIWIMHQLEKMGKTVPYDVALAGYDGFMQSRILTPPLTTIDPAWTDLGIRAVDAIMNLLNGNPVPERTVVTPRLVVAQTCGCLERSLEFAKEPAVRCGIAGTNRTKMAAALNGALHLDTQDKRGEEIINGFLDDIRGSAGTRFLRRLDMWLREAVRGNADLSYWQDAISILGACSRKKFSGMAFRSKADDICHQARVFINLVSSRHLENTHAERIQQADAEHRFGLKLISHFTLESLTGLLAEGLPAFGVREAYVALFENPVSYRYPAEAPEWARLVLAYNGSGIMTIPEGEERFRSRELVPERFRQHETVSHFSVHDLYFQANQIGFLVLDAQAGAWNLYEILSRQISSALQGTLLVRQINAHAAALKKGIESLSSTIGDMARNIETITANIYRQSTAVEESASSIHEMKGNIASIATISEQGATISHNLNEIAVQSIAAIKRLLETIEGIKVKSANILDMLSLIRDIAGRTRLLALNAAIQASRAGQSGGGFAVVAHEIRSLAENSDSSIDKIGAAVDVLMASIGESSTLSGKIGGNLDRMVDSLKLNLDASGQLSLAMQEQDKGAGEILKAIEEIVEITAQIKTTMTSQAKATEDFKAALISLRDSTVSLI